MVHKKSEYALNYHILQKDLDERKRIWQDNIKSRDSHRSLNRADHYWSFQLSGNCSCNKDVDDDDLLDRIVPHRIKHKQLVARYNSSLPTPVDGLLWSNDDHTSTKKRETDAATRETKQALVDPALLRSEEIGVQTPNWLNEDLVDDSSQELKDLDRIMSLNTISDKGTTPVRPPSPVPPQIDNTVPSERPLTVADLIPDCPIRESSRSRSLEARRLARSACSTSSRNTLTRTSRRAYFSEKMTPFASYGWNNKVECMGLKKTYNVSAPESEVDKHAVLTQRRRHEDVERFLREEAIRKQAISGERSRSVVNHSSIWRSEYQDRFTSDRSHSRNLKGKSARARSLSAARPVSSVQWYRENG